MLTKTSRLILSLVVAVVVYFILYALLSQKMNQMTAFVVSLIIALALLVFMLKTIKVKEGYAEVMIAPTYDPFFYSNPGFRAQLPPRFDSHRIGGGNIKSSFPGFDKQGAGVTPLSDNENCRGNMVKEGYNDMNNNGCGRHSEEIDRDDCNTGPSSGDRAGDFSSLGLMDKGISKYKKGCDAVKEDAVMKFKSAQGYADPEQLLPVPDIKNCLVDPSDPENYMYDRTLFAPLKMRNGYNTPDRVRGDLYIPPVNSGWFYAPTIPSVDLAKGAVNILNASIDNQDIIYSNSKPIVAPTEEEQLDIWKADPVNRMQSPWSVQSLHRE